MKIRDNSGRNIVTHNAPKMSETWLSELEAAIVAMTVQLQNCGGTLPRQTYEELLEEVPEPCGMLKRDDAIARCERIQQSEVVDESARFQELFVAFNAKYFAGRLPDYNVYVVFDVNFWANEYFVIGNVEVAEPSQGYHDAERRKIYLRHGADSLEAVLLHEMGHAATNGDHGAEWLAEMRRLHSLGASVCPSDLEAGCDHKGTPSIPRSRLTWEELNRH